MTDWSGPCQTPEIQMKSTSLRVFLSLHSTCSCFKYPNFPADKVNQSWNGLGWKIPYRSSGSNPAATGRDTLQRWREMLRCHNVHGAGWRDLIPVGMIQDVLLVAACHNIYIPEHLHNAVEAHSKGLLNTSSNSFTSWKKGLSLLSDKVPVGNLLRTFSSKFLWGFFYYLFESFPSPNVFTYINWQFLFHIEDPTGF